MIDGKALWIGAVGIAVLYEGLLCFGLGKSKLSQVITYPCSLNKKVQTTETIIPNIYFNCLCRRLHMIVKR